ncbi:RHS repeat-associated core domain-containing protein [Methylocaldum sp.]|uniref:RHS repeat-associated core domain-containing protein n=1 Tax=Methylocaldum sp. TaxID=1969727 RepID=UPI002D7998F5|nr:RHS repeat-associated core domain-containing protein [Methylocaldum sp.]
MPGFRRASTQPTGYRARYYDPTLGRFTQRDPAGFADGVNPYVYVGNNPVSFTDPLGLSKYNPVVVQNQSTFPGANNRPQQFGVSERKITNFSSGEAPIVTIGKAFGALAAYAQGAITGDQVLMNEAVEGMRENRQNNIDALVMLGTMGRGTSRGSVTKGVPTDGLAFELKHLNKHLEGTPQADRLIRAVAPVCWTGFSRT